jgi:hypothetical protein
MDGIELVVRGYFDGYKPGDLISDKATVDAILSGPHQHNVVRRKLISAPAPK